MSYSYPAVSSIYLPNPIKVGDKLGANGVAFSTVSEPIVIPEFTRKRRVKIYDDMASYELGVPGPRVIEAYKTDPNHYDVSWVSDMVTPDNVTRLRNIVENLDPDDPGYVTLTLGDGVYYLGVMAEDFPEVSNYRANLRTFHKVAIKVHILEVSTITSITTT